MRFNLSSVVGNAVATWAIGLPLVLFGLIWCVLPLLTDLFLWLGQF